MNFYTHLIQVANKEKANNRVIANEVKQSQGQPKRIIRGNGDCFGALAMTRVFMSLIVRNLRYLIYRISPLGFFLLISLPLYSQSESQNPKQELDKLQSAVRSWNELEVEQKESGERRQILTGSTTHLAYFEIHATTLLPNLASHPAHAHKDLEELIMVKEGELTVNIEGKREILGPGSIALILPKDMHGFENTGEVPTSYYVLKYRSKAPIDLERGKLAGGSFVVHWEEVEYREHNKGGRRDLFDRPTAMAADFEMHATNLNEKVQSHPPHTHEVEEIILMRKGNIEMHIDGATPKAQTGDLVFLDSMVPHAPTNMGKGQCLYFAFQWK